MRLNTCIVVATAILSVALVERAAADPEKKQGERETRFERHEIDEAITAAEDAAA
jgi:hypothetical protein